MRWIIGSSLRFRYLVLARRGAAGLRRRPGPDAPVDVPGVRAADGRGSDARLGHSSAEVEELITIPIEQALNGIAGLDEMRSYSVEQLSSIKLIFERGTDS